MNLDATKKAPLMGFNDTQKRQMLIMHFREKSTVVSVMSSLSLLSGD